MKKVALLYFHSVATTDHGQLKPYKEISAVTLVPCRRRCQRVRIRFLLTRHDTPSQQHLSVLMSKMRRLPLERKMRRCFDDPSPRKAKMFQRR